MDVAWHDMMETAWTPLYYLYFLIADTGLQLDRLLKFESVRLLLPEA